MVVKNWGTNQDTSLISRIKNLQERRKYIVLTKDKGKLLEYIQERSVTDKQAGIS